MKLNSTPKELSDMIKKAIEDHKITDAEYEKILDLAEADGVIDRNEKVLLSQLQSMIEDGSVKRVPH